MGGGGRPCMRTPGMTREPLSEEIQAEVGQLSGQPSQAAGPQCPHRESRSRKGCRDHARGPEGAGGPWVGRRSPCEVGTARAGQGAAGRAPSDGRSQHPTERLGPRLGLPVPGAPHRRRHTAPRARRPSPGGDHVPTAVPAPPRDTLCLLPHPGSEDPLPHSKGSREDRGVPGERAPERPHHEHAGACRTLPQHQRVPGHLPFAL